MEEKGHFINVLPDSGLVTLLAVVRERELRPRRSGGVYLHLLLAQDRHGIVEFSDFWPRCRRKYIVSSPRVQKRDVVQT